MKNIVSSYRNGVVIHPSCKIGTRVIMTTQSVFWKMKSGELKISKNCHISNFANLQCYGGKILIEERTFLGEFVSIYGHGDVRIGKDCLIAMNTSILSSNHSIPPTGILINSKPDIPLSTVIEDDVWIGANCVILGGITIEKGAVIGAGSVVTKNIPSYAIAVGNPAKVIKHRSPKKI
ncbi:DapH/DapD/GlmU-related protein [Pedobacter sp. ASV28]|uniref:acyltransferase n=1 Tax=Pedobacter sp. ASV28 TaxID=2795123 RepID=UPI0018EA666F|nr:acyltransferase [Pedobacter sp. ASV28]